MTKFLKFLTLLIWLYITVFIPTMLLIIFLNTFFPYSYSLAHLTTQIPALDGMLVSLLLLSVVGMSLGVRQTRFRPVWIWELSTSERHALILSSIAVAVLLSKFFFLVAPLKLVGLVLSFIFMLIYLPQIQNFLQSVNLDSFRTLLKSNSAKILTVFSLMVVHAFVLGINYQVDSYKNWRIIISRKPKIRNIEPEIVYHGTNVIVWGEGFGWLGNKANQATLVMDGEKINVQLLTDTKIIFTVPLHWEVGKTSFWLEKFTDWKGKKKLLKSNRVTINLISRFDPWDENDDAYFEQLPHLSQEAREINGHSSQ